MKRAASLGEDWGPGPACASSGADGHTQREVFCFLCAVARPVCRCTGRLRLLFCVIVLFTSTGILPGTTSKSGFVFCCLVTLLSIVVPAPSPMVKESHASPLYFASPLPKPNES